MRQYYHAAIKITNQRSILVYKTSFKKEQYKNSTTLSAELWRIKENNFTPNVNWRVIRHAPAYSPETKKCQLCLCEKMEIANHPDSNLLNKRTEIIAKCRHRAKHKLFQRDADMKD